MAQHDYNVSNANGSTVRSNMNAALAAILTANSGPSAPTVTAPFAKWADTSAGKLRMRDSLDSSWLDAVQALGLGGALTKITKFDGAPVGGQLSITFTAQPETEYVIVEVQGGGGPGVQAGAAGSATWHIAGAGGMSGAYCKAIITSGFQSVPVIVGGGGHGNSGPGKQSKFGSLVFCGGGYGGYQGATSPLPVISGGGAPGVSIFLDSGVIPLASIERRRGKPGFVFSSTLGVAGDGADSPMGPGARGAVITASGYSNGNAAPAGGYGAGGSGSYIIGSASSPLLLGGAGGGGCVIVYEFS